MKYIIVPLTPGLVSIVTHKHNSEALAYIVHHTEYTTRGGGVAWTRSTGLPLAMRDAVGTD